MTSSPARLSIQRSRATDGNPTVVQLSIGGRPTESAVIDVPSGDVYKPLYQNGYVVDENHMLFCGHKDCGRWKPDVCFNRDATAKTRRGRDWYCKECRAKDRHSGKDHSTEADRALRAKLTNSKRRKK